MRKLVYFLAFSVACPLLTFSQTPPAAKKAAPAAKKTAAATPASPLPARPDGLYVTFDMTHGGKPVGKIVARLYEKESPVTVKNFVDLALGRKAWKDPKTGKMMTKPLYNGLTFHRVIPQFMIQGGDPLGNGTGGTQAITDEFHPSLSMNRPGMLAMANAGPGTGSCQFFITETEQTRLDGKHPIFGEVVEGQDLVNSLARVPRGMNDKPNDPVVMQKLSVTRYPLGQPVGPIVKPAVAPKTAAPKTAAPKMAPKKTVAPAKKAA